MEKYLLENKELIDILSGLGTFISSILALYTLREVVKQRLSTYKPEILIKSFVTYINKSPLELKPGELLKYKSDNFNEYKKNSEDIGSREFGVSCLYKLENLGFGPAKKVKLEWTYDVKKALNLIENMFPDRYFFNPYKPLNYYFLNDRQNENYHFSITNENVTLQEIDYLTPINVKEHSHYHTIPKAIILTYYLYYIFKNKLLNTNSENCYGERDFSKLPKPKLKIKYQDLNGKTYSKKIEFYISLVSTQTDDIIKMDREFGYLLFEII